MYVYIYICLYIICTYTTMYQLANTKLYAKVLRNTINRLNILITS